MKRRPILATCHDATEVARDELSATCSAPDSVIGQLNKNAPRRRGILDWAGLIIQLGSRRPYLSR